MHFDTKMGKGLDERTVAAARKEKIEFMRQIKLYDKVDWEECIRMTGRPPVSTKWVEVDKGTAEKPDVRCRLVAQDFRVKGGGHRDDLSAAMPPVEAKKLLFKMAAATWQGGVVGADVWACIELPEEDYEEGKYGRLRRWLYGMRPAAKAWVDDNAEKLESTGFLRGKAAPTVFHFPGSKVRIVVHGDDFTVTGKQQHLDMVKTAMREWYIITVKGVMGPDAGDCKDMCVLNRRLKVEGEFLIYEPDWKHAKILCEGMGLKEGSKGVGAPVAREDAAAAGTEEEPLGPEETTRFRVLAARANYIAQDRVDVQFAAKELCREMSSPITSSWCAIEAICTIHARVSECRVEVPHGDGVHGRCIGRVLGLGLGRMQGDEGIHVGCHACG